MKVAMFNAHEFERSYFEAANNQRHEINFIEQPLTSETAQASFGHEVACCSVSDRLDTAALAQLKKNGVSLIALRSAGFNHLDARVARELKLTAVYVPSYSPHAIAEYAVGLVLALNRRIHSAHVRVSELCFNLDGFVGFDLNGKTVGVVGTGRIGKIFCKIMKGFGCRVIAFDAHPDAAWAKAHEVEYRELADVLASSDIVSLHVPLTRLTRHLISESSLSFMKPNSVIINTARGAIIDTEALLDALDSKKIAGAGLDVYEFEEPVFFFDHPVEATTDKLLNRLIAHPNVLLTGHQAFLTKEALTNIAETTIASVTKFEQGLDLTKFLVPISKHQ